LFRWFENFSCHSLYIWWIIFYITYEIQDRVEFKYIKYYTVKTDIKLKLNFKTGRLFGERYILNMNTKRESWHKSTTIFNKLKQVWSSDPDKCHRVNFTPKLKKNEYKEHLHQKWSF
jgi:hypothetical protein